MALAARRRQPRHSTAPSPAATPVRGGTTVQGLPLLKPPYATISAISLTKGEIVWQVPHGDTPDAVRNHPALKGLTIPKTGQPGYNISTLVTKTLVIAGDGQVTTTDTHPRGALLRAYDKATGKEVGGVLDSGASERLADDVLGERPAIHRRGSERRRVLGGIHRVRAAERGAELTCDGAKGKGQRA